MIPERRAVDVESVFEQVPNRSVFTEPRRYRYMRLGLPVGLLYFVLIIVVLGVGFDIPAVIFVLALVALVAQAGAAASLTAQRVEVSNAGLRVQTLFREVSIRWGSVEACELVDRKDQAFPHRLLRIAARHDQVFILDSMTQFDQLLDLVLRHAHVGVTRMPLWRRLVLLQWTL